MKRLILAFKCFVKAFKVPERAGALLSEPEKEEKVKKDKAHLQLLRNLQNAGRLIDFLSEDISQYTDNQVGAAVRQIHAGCRKSLDELVAVKPLMDEKEGASVTVPIGYSSKEFKLVGNVKGEPPYQGTLVHRGWKAHKHSLPKIAEEESLEILTPAEIELK